MAKVTKADLEQEIKALKAEFEIKERQLQSIIDFQTDKISKLDNERIGVANDVFDGVIKELENAKQSRDDFKKLYEKEKKKREALTEKYEASIKSNTPVHKIKNERNAGRKPINPSIVSEVKQLREEGHSMREIAKNINISASLVHKILHEDSI